MRPRTNTHSVASTMLRPMAPLSPRVPKRFRMNTEKSLNIPTEMVSGKVLRISSTESRMRSETLMASPLCSLTTTRFRDGLPP